MAGLLTALRRLLGVELGASVVEHSLLLVLIAAVGSVAMAALGNALRSVITAVANRFSHLTLNLFPVGDCPRRRSFMGPEW
jgi:Flp pilus assembly pilin Flp